MADAIEHFGTLLLFHGCFVHVCNMFVLTCVQLSCVHSASSATSHGRLPVTPAVPLPTRSCNESRELWKVSTELQRAKAAVAEPQTSRTSQRPMSFVVWDS